MAQKNNKNPQLGIVVLVVLLVLAGFGIVSLYQNQNKETKAKILPKTATLTLASEAKTVTPGESFTVNLIMDSGNQGVEAADFTLTFDPKYLQVTNVSAGGYFKSYPVNKIEENSVKISGVAYFDGSSVIIPKGRGEVAAVTFSAVQPVQKTSVKIDRAKTTVAASGQNILSANKITDLSIRVKK